MIDFIIQKPSNLVSRFNAYDVLLIIPQKPVICVRFLLLSLNYLFASSRQTRFTFSMCYQFYLEHVKGLIIHLEQVYL